MRITSVGPSARTAWLPGQASRDSFSEYICERLELAMSIPRWLVLAFTMITLLSCQKLIRDPQADAEAKRAFDEVRHHQNDAFMAHLDSTLDKSAILGQLPEVQKVIPSEDPLSRNALGTTIVDSAGKTVVTTTDEYDYRDKILIVQVRLFKFDAGGVWAVQGFHAQSASLVQLAVNDFTLKRKSWDQYLFLLLALASPAIIVAAVVKVLLRERRLRRKWLWAFAAVVGFCTLKMNWTTGAVSVDPLSFQIFAVGAVRAASPFAPWIISVSVPVVAVLILTGVLARSGGAGATE